MVSNNQTGFRLREIEYIAAVSPGRRPCRACPRSSSGAARYRVCARIARAAFLARQLDVVKCRRARGVDHIGISRVVKREQRAFSSGGNQAAARPAAQVQKAAGPSIHLLARGRVRRLPSQGILLCLPPVVAPASAGALLYRHDASVCSSLPSWRPFFEVFGSVLYCMYVRGALA